MESQSSYLLIFEIAHVFQEHIVVIAYAHASHGGARVVEHIYSKSLWNTETKSICESATQKGLESNPVDNKK